MVDFNGAYKGGIIAPGINLSLDALVGNTAAVAGASGDVSQLYPLVSANGHMGFVLGWVGLGALATLIQLRTTSRAWVKKSSKKS